MGHKIFVSYKYWDTSVEPIGNKAFGNQKVRDYVNYLQKMFQEWTDDCYKGELDGEDLGRKSDEYIWNQLKERLYDSSVTILLISPCMKEPYQHERNQWIPWEIYYSLRRVTRNGRTSQPNAIVAVVLPDIFGDYDYANDMSFFQIINNNWDYMEHCRWCDFVLRPDFYVERAIQIASKRTPTVKL